MLLAIACRGGRSMRAAAAVRGPCLLQQRARPRPAVSSSSNTATTSTTTSSSSSGAAASILGGNSNSSGNGGGSSSSSSSGGRGLLGLLGRACGSIAAAFVGVYFAAPVARADEEDGTVECEYRAAMLKGRDVKRGDTNHVLHRRASEALCYEAPMPATALPAVGTVNRSARELHQLCERAVEIAKSPGAEEYKGAKHIIVHKKALLDDVLEVQHADGTLRHVLLQAKGTPGRLWVEDGRIAFEKVAPGPRSISRQRSKPQFTFSHKFSVQEYLATYTDVFDSGADNILFAFKSGLGAPTLQETVANDQVRWSFVSLPLLNRIIDQESFKQSAATRALRAPELLAAIKKAALDHPGEAACLLDMTEAANFVLRRAAVLSQQMVNSLHLGQGRHMNANMALHLALLEKLKTWTGSSAAAALLRGFCLCYLPEAGFSTLEVLTPEGAARRQQQQQQQQQEAGLAADSSELELEQEEEEEEQQQDQEAGVLPHASDNPKSDTYGIRVTTLPKNDRVTTLLGVEWMKGVARVSASVARTDAVMFVSEGAAEVYYVMADKLLEKGYMGLGGRPGKFVSISRKTIVEELGTLLDFSDASATQFAALLQGVHHKRTCPGGWMQEQLEWETQWALELLDLEAKAKALSSLQGRGFSRRNPTQQQQEAQAALAQALAKADHAAASAKERLEEQGRGLVDELRRELVQAGFQDAATEWRAERLAGGRFELVHPLYTSFGAGTSGVVKSAVDGVRDCQEQQQRLRAAGLPIVKQGENGAATVANWRLGRLREYLYTEACSAVGGLQGSDGKALHSAAAAADGWEVTSRSHQRYRHATLAPTWGQHREVKKQVLRAAAQQEAAAAAARTEQAAQRTAARTRQAAAPSSSSRKRR